MGCDLLLLAAFHPELAPLRTALGEGMSARIGGRDVAARVVGIGLPMAAAGAAMQLGEMQPRAVVLLGTCGAYVGSGVALGEVIAARRIRLVDPSVVHGASQFPDPMSVATDAHPVLLQALLRGGARAADVATTLAVTVDDAVAARIAQTAAVHVEHLEAYGVAAACAARGVPFGAALGVANHVGARAREEWRAHSPDRRRGRRGNRSTVPRRTVFPRHSLPLAPARVRPDRDGRRVRARPYVSGATEQPMRRRLAWMVAAACLLGACATGVDSADNGGLGAGDAGGTLEAGPGNDAGSGGHDSGAAEDTGASTQDTGSTGADGSQADDGPSVVEAAVTQDTGTIEDTGTTVPETSTAEDTGTTSGGQCGGAAKYGVEAAVEIASGTITFCFSGVCGAGLCCFEGLKPGNVCVAE